MSNVVFAITIGSRRVTAAAVKFAGKIRSEIILEETNTEGAVRHGRIVNVANMKKIINGLIVKLNNRAKTGNMREAYIAIGGISMHSVKHTSTNPELPDLYPIETEYLDNNEYIHTTMDVKAVTAVEDVLSAARIKCIGGMISIPKATATILTPEEKEDGCILVDIGFGTTTVQIFSEGHLQHLAVIPIGGDAVTRDLMTHAKINHDLAESIKINWCDASVNIDNFEEDKREVFEETQLPISRQLRSNIVVCRYEEILKNVLAQIHNSGVNAFKICVLTGGGSKQKGIETLTRRVLDMPALAVQHRAFSEPCDIMSGQRFEQTDIYGLCSLCLPPDNNATEATTTEAPQENPVAPAASAANPTTPTQATAPAPANQTNTAPDVTPTTNKDADKKDAKNDEGESQKKEKRGFLGRIFGDLLSSNN